MKAPTSEQPGADAGNQGTPADGEARMEWALIQRVLSGEQKAFELLVVKYQKRIERLVTRMVRDSDQASDITQDVFISAYRSLRQFRGDARFYTWLHRIAVNTAYKALQEKEGSGGSFVGITAGKRRCRGNFSGETGTNQSG